MGRPAGSPNKLTAEIKEKLSSIINDALDSLDVKTMSKVERLKLIQIGLQYVIPRLKQVENVEEEMPRNFQIEIIDRLSKKTDKELDEAIRG
ncbi:hypothetical protein N9523_00435 [Flavobacteriaceae bacterium]|nr:hypothetical protein [Flavobacteriaceae bacterium]